MRAFHLFISVVLVVMLVWMSRWEMFPGDATYGGLSWVGWTSVLTIVLVAGIVFVFNDAARAFSLFRWRGRSAARIDSVRTLTSSELGELGIDKYRGPAYPHPIVFPDRCIGCQACVDACPHDVLAIVDGVAAAVAPDLCMEDTSCQAECPVNPKACIVINTAKPVVTRPAPTRNGADYQTNVPGCYIVGDVSGVPLIKNAVKEGYEVIGHIAAELKTAPTDEDAEFDVAIIGIGPAGASAAMAAQESGLRYVAIEQDKTLASIEAYPKGKYIFFKPDTKDWFGGLPLAGLGVTRSKYAEATNDGAGLPDLASDDAFRAECDRITNTLLGRIPVSLHGELATELASRVEAEMCTAIARFVRSQNPADPMAAYRSEFLPQKGAVLAKLGQEVAAQFTSRVPGDQRENILRVWLGAMEAKAVRINQFEGCKSVSRADGADHFVIETLRRDASIPTTYRARRVVLAIGLRGAPNKLRLPNEDMRFSIDGREEQKVLYSLSNPGEFRGRRIAIVGGGNVAVEAAVDLVAVRNGSEISPRPAGDMNRVTVLVRDSLAPTVKFGNKFQLYRCAEDGLLDLRFGVAIKEMRERELVLEEVETGRELETIPNDFVFALIGGERPDRFLKSIGITLT